MEPQENAPNPIRELLTELLPGLIEEELTIATERYRRYLEITWEIFEQSEDGSDYNEENQH